MPGRNVIWGWEIGSDREGADSYIERGLLGTLFWARKVSWWQYFSRALVHTLWPTTRNTFKTQGKKKNFYYRSNWTKSNNACVRKNLGTLKINLFFRHLYGASCAHVALPWRSDCTKASKISVDLPNCLKSTLRHCEQTNISGSITNKIFINCKRKVLVYREKRPKCPKRLRIQLHSWDLISVQKLDVRKSLTTTSFLTKQKKKVKLYSIIY